ncbi:NADH-ubiquinone oxidoreductase 14.8 kDa subunit [Lachnellula cervina]|uniref:NADH-ubiquinone oxidoreductase 14.8 kDa subunit n=1 Tax=Lachnellula cervina TaxID=1316786 RepID=A0A7D8YMT6_9HELO|nr:NADH-ubiquinone oxidoreductase 14.8 kDa subunit [Lachnellula cervina]
MVINPTYLAQRTRQSTANEGFSGAIGNGFVPYVTFPQDFIEPWRQLMAWGSRGDDWNWANGWILQAPEIQTMYSLNIPVPQLRTKMRQEFERHRYVNQMGVVDMLLFQSHAEFQETLNYWKQLPHILKYFRADEDPNARLPPDFMSGFLEASSSFFAQMHLI